MGELFLVVELARGGSLHTGLSRLICKNGQFSGILNHDIPGPGLQPRQLPQVKAIFHHLLNPDS